MNLAVAIYSAVLFFILSPGVLLRLPSNGSKFMVAAVHALVFGILLYITSGFVNNLVQSLLGRDQEDFSFLNEDEDKEEEEQEDFTSYQPYEEDDKEEFALIDEEEEDR